MVGQSKNTKHVKREKSPAQELHQKGILLGMLQEKAAFFEKTTRNGFSNWGGGK